MTIPGKAVVAALLLASACGGGGGGGGAKLPEQAPVDGGPFESYRTDHNGFARVRMDRSTPKDAAILRQFEDANPADPAGYRNLLAQTEASYEGKMVVEAIAEVDTAKGGKAKRLLRLTADQNAFENVRNGKLVTTGGKYYFRGESFAWVTIDDGPLLSGHHRRGLENLELDFDTGTASIDIRTEVANGSEVEIALKARDLPFDIVSGAYGGAVTVNVRNPNADRVIAAGGNLRGNVGGRPVYTDNVHGMTTSGLYTAQGSAGGTTVKVDGLYRGADPNAAP
jgi:hypothetical protein